MATVEEAQQVLAALGVPLPQQNRMSALTLLALCELAPTRPWALATRRPCTLTKDLMDYVEEHYGAEYAPNTRETFRRQVLHQFVHCKVADYNPFDPELPTNSPNAHYAISPEALEAVVAFGTSGFDNAAGKFRALSEGADRKSVREEHMVGVTVPDGQQLMLSPGRHNIVQKAVIEQFAPRFAPGAQLLYLGDTAKKELILDSPGLSRLGISITKHNKLPDIVLYDEARNWLFLIEAVASHGPISTQRLADLEALLADCDAGPVYVTAFPDRAEYRKHAGDIAWETEVWLVDAPNHMIHFDGDRFLGPRG